MYSVTTCLKNYETNETIYIGRHWFELIKGTETVRQGLFINKEEIIEELIKEGFEVVD